MNMMLAVEIESVRKLPTDEMYRAVLYILCDHNYKPVPAIVITGVAGDIKSDSNRIPFVILKDGRGDYGSEYDDPSERFFRTNLRSKIIRPGELFTTWWSTAEQPHRINETSFKIKKATPLAGTLAA
ncbi:hypothetical protein JQ543_32955 [Bradyrhizobium diazoefficiens]|nr:hypothetical protein [Bradyrhizobium diazoefficiens]MBR0852580.1 hypothetical protein [Bradyrhizobium diazoefficiens]